MRALMNENGHDGRKLRIQRAELEIRDALRERPGEALSCLVAAYDSRNQNQKESFVVAAMGHLVALSAVSKLEGVLPSA